MCCLGAKSYSMRKALQRSIVYCFCFSKGHLRYSTQMLFCFGFCLVAKSYRQGAQKGMWELLARVLFLRAV